MVCRCGFTHDILWIHCDECSTLQHAYCYYDSEVEAELPDSHLCDECKLDDETVLSQEVAKLRIHLEKSDEKKRRELKQRSADVTGETGLQDLGPFGLPVHERISWGPDDHTIQNYHSVIRSELHNIAHSLEPELNIPPPGMSDRAHSEDTALLVQMTLGAGDECWLRPDIEDPARYRPKRRQLLRAILAAAMAAWIFRIPDTLTVSYDSILLFHYQEEVLEKRK